MCPASPAERKRAERARKGVQPRAEYLAGVAAACGTERAYRTHLKNGEQCSECRSEHARRAKAQRAR